MRRPKKPRPRHTTYVLTRGALWSVGVYSQPQTFQVGEPLGALIKVFDTKRLSLKADRVHTYADPFLFVHSGELYLFLEAQSVGQPGQIVAFRTADLCEFESLGSVLTKPFHLSYPFVFAQNSAVFLVPESASAGEVALYQFESFPRDPRKVRVLVEGHYADSSLIQCGRYWYLFTTSDAGLEIFLSDDLLNGRFIAHPCNPVITDARFSRCGGGPLKFDNRIYRFAQDCSIEYGRNLHVMEITHLSPIDYQERLLVFDYLKRNESWNRRGGHHLSIATFAGATVVAVDGKQHDYLLNKISSVVSKFNTSPLLLV